MIIDDFEIFLFLFLQKSFNERKDVNAVDIAKAYYKSEGDEFKNKYNSNANRFIVAKTNFVIKRCQKLSKDELIKIKKKENINLYILDNDRVILKKYKLPNNKIKECVCIFGLNNKWNIFEM